MCVQYIHTHTHTRYIARDGTNENGRERKGGGRVEDEMGVGEEISATDRCATHARTQTYTGGKKTKKEKKKKKTLFPLFSRGFLYEESVAPPIHLSFLKNYCWALYVFVDFSHPLVPAPLYHSSRRFAQIETRRKRRSSVPSSNPEYLSSRFTLKMIRKRKKKKTGKAQLVGGWKKKDAGVSG